MADLGAIIKSSENYPTNSSLPNKNELNEASKKATVEEDGIKIAGREPVLVNGSQQLDSESERKALIDEVKENLERLNKYIPVTSTNLKFEFDEKGDPPIIKVYDKESEKVIREIPSEEFREVAKALEEFADKLANKGLLLNQTA
ncbi:MULTISPECIES: flagellar protein FlaG [Pseudoalteromonas]|uniref:flagellar protein FlaG n=1 Tax=Pseudoalteromonas TaxID=53246 RepID=UPI0013FDA82D|nr:MULTISPECIES: flagellar protein FlaG [Pseudoalteromonas]|tara:strand:- start:13875 stop:14309 length:435 start_codon:yes stop_codon:yes gene_type:complete